MILAVFLLITTLSVCTAQESSVADGFGDRQDKLDRCRSTDECEPGVGKRFVDYDIRLGKQTGRDLYYTESHTIKTGGKITFKISEKKRMYYPRTEYYSSINKKVMESLFSRYEPSPDNTPWVVDGKLQPMKFLDVHQSQYQRYPRDFAADKEPREIDAEYTCEGFPRYNQKKICTIEVYLMTFTVPYQVRSMDKNKTCECINDRGIYTITNIPDVVYAVKLKSIV